MLARPSPTIEGRDATTSIWREATLAAYEAFARKIAKTGRRAAMTAFMGEPARRPPTYPAIIGPAGWIHHSRKERIRMTRDEDQNEKAGPSPWKRCASPSTSIRYTPGWCGRRRGGL